MIDRLLAAGVENRSRLGDVGSHLQQQGRLADTGVSSQEGHRAGDEATAEDPIQLLLPGRGALYGTRRGKHTGGRSGGCG